MLLCWQQVGVKCNELFTLKLTYKWLKSSWLFYSSFSLQHLHFFLVSTTKLGGQRVYEYKSVRVCVFVLCIIIANFGFTQNEDNKMCVGSEGEWEEHKDN